MSGTRYFVAENFRKIFTVCQKWKSRCIDFQGFETSAICKYIKYVTVQPSSLTEAKKLLLK